MTPVTDSFRNGKTLNSDVEILVQPREIETLNQRLVKNSGFSETDAVLPEPDELSSAEQQKANTGPVLFKPVASDKLPRQGKTLSALRKTEAKLFTKSLSGNQHPVSAVADLSHSEVTHGPKTFTGGV